ncbi:hypothetical protein SAMN04489735_103928 [Aneurinibacillus thermoaerophilus]|uniref:Uncharacterized protein n=1 Tax=Aneurinibacillus thermoaerophilus TaxID=143495 RepID=A0A1G8E4S0_ANETH|nr:MULTISPECIES: hypothetical protein [Aneurinibacillus]AMA74208.1 hypothetical protein ACH33_16200 [Aneurinibacillus sp. XH2]MED0676933.1 hypothetical protein [Aneurinibacillus thermoaerophilus]MED0681360.1 hypothetical protein [Aneurinibacillus thermoaerophilus]MED0765683.1 hypothetical protein [Aneurinibacillus thermoaerophilus]SDH64867.1 hypothetical protein SAMN04489735_103928 [Aneurinibacillus thermoaerophilus]
MKKRKRGWATWLLFTVIIICFFSSGLFPVSVRADSTAAPVVSIKVNVGFNNTYKWDTIVPVRVTVTNQTDAPINGNIELDMRTNHTFVGTYSKPLSLKKGESKHVTFRVHAQFSYFKNNPSYVKWVQNGKTLVKHPMAPNNIPNDSIFVGILANEAVTTHLLRTQPPEKANAPSIHVQPLTLEDIPADTLRNSGLNALLIDKEEMARLNEQQKKTVKDWAAQGGQLFTVDQTSGKGLWETIGKKAENDTSSWNGTYMASQLSDAATYMPEFKLPDVSLAALLFAAYIIIIGPVLFYIMKRRNAREWNWLFIPALSIIAALATYGYGKWQYGNKVHLQNVSLIEVNNDGSADIRSGSAFFAPHSGDYSLRFPKGITVFPLKDRERGNPRSNTRILLQTDHTEAQFTNTAFWSLRQAFSEQHQEGIGTFAATLTTQNNRITGTIRNHTNYALRNVCIVYKDGVQTIPALAPGDSIQVNVPIRSVDTPRSFLKSDFAKALLPASLDVEKRNYTRSPEARLIESIYHDIGEQGIYLIGWTDQHPLKNEVINESYQLSQLSVVKAKIGELKETGGVK